MTTALTPRPYQLEAVEEAMKKNTLINIMTGGGKTLIAAIVIDKFIKLSKKTICFLVPSRALVDQQTNYLLKNCETNNGKQISVEGLAPPKLWRFTGWIMLTNPNFPRQDYVARIWTIGIKNFGKMRWVETKSSSVHQRCFEKPLLITLSSGQSNFLL
jgi:CRISPR/Cas system-associated endonuclease/helicase Cas3